MNNTLHMKLLLSSTALLMTLTHNSFASDLELKPISDLSTAFKLAKVCFLPDCENDLGDITIDTRWCEKKGFTYYSSGECPQYYKVTDTCKKDNHYLKCDANAWCKDNGYNTASCSLPKFIDTQCPNGEPLYKTCKEDTARACKQLGYTNTCSGSQKLHASNGRCSWNNAYGTCCSPSGCPIYTSLTGTYGSSGSQDGCGYACSYTCNMDCPSSYPYTSDPTGCSLRTTNGCGNKNCYQSKACCTPSCTNSTGCSCGTYTVSNGCGGTCTKCSSCCDNSCAGSSPCSANFYQTTSRDGCGNTCYNCYSGKLYKKQWAGGVNGSGRGYSWYLYAQEYCVYKSGSHSNIGGVTQTYRGCWDCDYTHAQCGVACSYSCYHSNPKYSSYENYITDHYNRDCFDSWTGGYCN